VVIGGFPHARQSCLPLVIEQIYSEIKIDFNPHPQAFPDIAVGNFGVEVKFTLSDTWRSVANSVMAAFKKPFLELCWKLNNHRLKAVGF
jgi:hypothetical protein